MTWQLTWQTADVAADVAADGADWRVARAAREVTRLQPWLGASGAWRECSSRAVFVSAREGACVGVIRLFLMFWNRGFDTNTLVL